MLNRQSSNRKLSYYLLPVTFWLLAIGSIVVWHVLSTFNFHLSTYIPALLTLLAAISLRHIPRHQNAVEPSFRAALLLGVAAYWLPSVLFLIIPMWGYLIARRLLNERVILATFIGLATVAIWVVVLSQFSICNLQFSLAHNLHLWIPTALVLSAWLASTILRQILRER